ncbi:hypothetical protein BDZ45DRAFT_659104 [Acephala macrosclerotiorum]|nr:hypothetical protein BDZ45DRAFT_659104 [Acephala macrosclerotiorum]
MSAPTPLTSRDFPIDVLVIGAGPTSLAFGTSIARLLHTCIIFSHNQFRNQKSHHMHGIPTWEHRSPAEFRAAARADILSHYSATFFEDIGISSIEKHSRKDGTSLFKAVDENGKEWRGRKLVFATREKNIILNISVLNN